MVKVNQNSKSLTKIMVKKKTGSSFYEKHYNKKNSSN